MSGFKHNSLADIHQLQEMLGDRYDFSSIPKELVQNADDARAEQLHFGWCPGWPDSDHGLLRGSALLVLNDGQFLPKDFEGIRSLGLGSKGGDPRSIGKFGLGMKSIFHLCEAFIYLASKNQPGARGEILCDILNPWSSSGFHDQWDELDSHRDILIRTVEEWSHGTSRWLCLWIPLRTKQQLDGKYPIVEEYPKVSEFFDAGLPRRLARLFPFLGSLKTLDIWQHDSQTGLQMDVGLALDTGACRRRFLDLAVGETNQISGLVTIRHYRKTVAAEGQDALLRGRETMLRDEQLSTLQCNEEFWPARPTYDPQTAKATMVREKGYPHAGAAFSILPCPIPNKGSLEVNRAVFLPLSSTLDKQAIGGRYDFQLLLHGYFFLDAGRRDIHPGNRWNDLLERRGTLPLLLPVLEDLKTQATHITTEDFRRLTKGLSEVSLLREHAESLCHEYQWIYRLQAEGGCWSLVPSDVPFLCIPEPPDGADWSTQELFPALRALVEQKLVSFFDWPRLTLREPTSWVESGQWAELLKVPAQQFLKSVDRLEYLNEVLQNEGRLMKREVWENTSSNVPPLLSVGRELFRMLTEETAETHLAELKRFVAILPEKSWFTLPNGEGELTVPEFKAIVDGLLNLDLSILLVPSNLVPEHGRHGSPTAEDAVLILSWLESSTDPDLAKKRSAVALEVAACVSKRDLDTLRIRSGDIKVFRAYDLKASREISASWNELAAWLGEQRLFGSGGVFTEPLQRALSASRIYRLIGSDHRTGEVLFPDHGVSACDAATCVAILRTKPALAPPELRKPLLERLLDQPGRAVREEHVEALRYLLHAHPDHVEDVTTHLLASSQDGGHDIWGRLAGSVLRQKAAAWRWVSGELSEVISPEHCRYLRVSLVGPESVQILLSEAESLDWLNGQALTTEDRKEVLTRITDEQLWRRVPLHETLDGRFVAISGPTYLAADNPIPIELAGLVTALRVPEDPLLKAVYHERVPQWEPRICISFALDQEEPHRFESVILDAIEQVRERATELGDDLESRLKESPWLIARAGPVRPRDVLNLPGLEDALSRLLAEPEVRGTFVDVSSVDVAVAQCPAGRWIAQRLYTRGGEALEVLGMILSEVPRYRLGLSRTHLSNEDELKDLLKAFDDGGPQGFPTYALLQSAVEKFSSQVSRLVTGLLKPISIEAILSILSYLSHRAEQAVGEDRQGLRAVHSLYLRALTESPGASLDQLRNLRLLSRKKRWKPAQELTLDVPGVDDADLLDENHKTILSPLLANRLTGGMETFPDSTVEDSRALPPEKLMDYFRPWYDRVPSEAIGGLVALLGDEPSMMSAAEELLRGRRTVFRVREMISWEVGPAEAQAVGANEDIHQAMAKQRVQLFLQPSPPDATVTVPNLLGEPFEAHIQQMPEHLFVGPLETAVYPGFRCYVVKLREIDPSAFTKDQLCALLRESAALILRVVYRRSPENLEAVWDELSQSEQLDLEVAQRLILESAFFYFRQLNDGTLSSSLREFGKRWDEIRYREAEEERSVSSGRAPARFVVLAEKLKIRSELQEALERNPSTQTDTLAAVRHKVSDYQYQESSIPFELFQNADDAASELVEMLGEKAVRPANRRFVVCSGGDRLAFLHWGRAINRFRGGDFSAVDGIARGFNRDLEKMLVLSSSDKPGNTSHSTGKFGLGFKSVFLVSDAPKVLSGRLGFEVMGGMFPRRLSQEDREELTRLLEQHTIAASEGTAVELLLRANPAGTASKALDWFRELGHLLPAFSRAISDCVWSGNGPEPQTASWSGTTVSDIGSISFGRLNPFIGSTHRGSGALLFRCGAEGTVLFGVDSRGICPLPPSTPSFWVTAPTRELVGRGIAINGNFELDVGRTQLARMSEFNQRLARRLGEQLGELFEALHRASSQWQRIRSDSELALDATAEEFWHSLWSVVSQALPQDEQGSGAVDLLRTILWKNGCGMNRLLWHADALPTELPGRFSCLTRLEMVRHFTSGALIDRGLFLKVSDWEEFAKKVLPGTIIAQSVHEPLRRLLEKAPDWRPMRLIDAIAWEIPRTKEIEPALGTRLGDVVRSELLTRLENDHATKDEGQQLAEFLAGCRFKSGVGRFREVRDLVTARQHAEDRDEALRAAFAPSDRILHQDYKLLALEFFRACRGKLRAPAETLVQWGCGANDLEKREAFLRYLLEGSLNVQVSNLAVANRSDTWLDSLPQSSLLNRFSPADRLTILGRLGFEQQAFPEPESLPPPPPTGEVQAFLRDVELWWSKDRIRASMLEEYLQRQYPSGCYLNLAGRDRRSWMILLIRAMGYTMGRTQDWQTRGFIERCDQRMWLDTFAMEPPSQSSSADQWNRNWIAVLNDFALEGLQYVEYLHWVKLLPIVYRVATHLDKYTENFLSLDRGTGADVDPYKILTPALDEELEGGPPTAPSLLQSVGLGIFFILRELVRTETILGDRIRSHCFVPSLRIRKGFKSLGCNLNLYANGVARLEWSKEIVAFLDERGVQDSTFHRTFDIPFIVLSNPGWLDDADKDGHRLKEFWQKRDF